MMGSGKSTVGEVLARHLAIPFHDLDDEITTTDGRPLTEIWEDVGEAGFRRLEAEAVDRLAGRSAVVATGGGVVLASENVSTMRATGTVIWLRTAIEELVERVGDGSGRPLLDGDAIGSRLRTIADERLELYEAAAHLIVDTDGLEVEAVAERVRAWIAS